MGIKTALFTFLKADGPIAAIVGTKVFQGSAPKKAALDYIVFQRIANPGDHHMTAAVGLASPTFQIDCYAATGTRRTALYEAVRDSFDGLGPTTWSGVSVQAVFLDTDVDSEEPAKDGSEKKIYRNRMDVEIWHTRSVPTF